MSFVKDTVNRTPIIDNVFGVASKAKAAKAEIGKENVVDSTLGSLFDENGDLVALDTVFDSLKSLDNRNLAAYAASFTGNPAFREKAVDWVLNNNSSLYKEVIATPGGTGAVGISVTSTLEPGQTLIIPEIAWGSYSLMAQMSNIKTAAYSLFEGDHFNLDSFKKTVQDVMKTQDKVVVIINDPCHNPTGYTMSEEEWKEVVDFLNECSKTHSVVLINDIAYIDFSYRKEKAKEYFHVFDSISPNMAVVVAFSISKAMTSYGLRCGAAIILANSPEAVEEIKIVFEKEARAIWSNINNGAMQMFVDVLDNHQDAYLAEKQKYVDLLEERSSIFVKEAAEAGLSHYPYKEGFFITLDLDNETADKFHAALMDEHIYTVKVNKGIRVAVCAVPVFQIKGLAGRMKEILDKVTA
ncbi:MAG: aminotransferase class I/II-fold pyridoxal phosphate-dependent enzyme [Erysipelotrichaceae bacterium]|nr:aminotransferase class I/II-fold pyridoxal phosphate-dependent enzyme [Erysipelotrichaceae bacterium]